MAGLKGLFERLRPKTYGRRPPLILLNGLAEQHESWFRNKRFWARYFDVYAPNIMVYDGAVIQNRIENKQPVTVEFLVEQLHTFLDQFVQSPPYNLVSSSLGGKVAVEFAAKYPHLVHRVILLCPSGMGDVEKLPIMEGVRGGAKTMPNVVRSVFHNVRRTDRSLVMFYAKAIENRKWKKGLLRTVNGTLDHTVRSRMKDITAETLLVTGQYDKICDPKTAQEAAAELPHGHFLSIPNCGHAPQIEKHWLINRLVVHFLTATNPTANPRWTQLFLSKPSRAVK
jgi:pimeloyl-ACP methyl ester carboxylesterase